MKKAVFYGRYSSANQTEQSIEGQLHVCEKYAAENGITIVKQYIDRALSGTTDKRPQFLQMIADSRHGGFEMVLVYKLDRFARNRYDSALHKKKLRDNGVRVRNPSLCTPLLWLAFTGRIIQKTVEKRRNKVLDFLSAESYN